MVLLESYTLLKEDVDDVEKIGRPRVSVLCGVFVKELEGLPVDDVEMIGRSEIGVPRELSVKKFEELP